VSIQTAWQASFDFWGALPIHIEPSQAQLTSDAGLLPLRQFDEHIGLTQQFAQALEDPRSPRCCGHSFLEMVRSRLYGILADYEDQKRSLFAGLTISTAATNRRSRSRSKTRTS